MMSANYIYILTVFLISIVFTNTIHSQETKEEIVVVGDKGNPPYEFINDRGENDGFSVELLKAIMKEIDEPDSIVLETWKEV